LASEGAGLRTVVVVGHWWLPPKPRRIHCLQWYVTDHRQVREDAPNSVDDLALRWGIIEGDNLLSWGIGAVKEAF